MFSINLDPPADGKFSRIPDIQIQDRESLTEMTEPTRDNNQVRLVHLEETVAHQDQLLGQLNESLTLLRDQYDRLENKLEQASSQVQWLMENSNPGEDLPHEKPPHY